MKKNMLFPGVRRKTVALLLAGSIATVVSAAYYQTVTVSVGGVDWKVKIETESDTASVGPNIAAGGWGASSSRAFEIDAYEGALTVPDTVTYGGTEYRIVSIANRAMYNCVMTGLTFPAGVTNFWNEAFYGCSRLTDVCLKGPSTADAGSAQTYVTFYRGANAFKGAANVSFALIGPNIKSAALTGDETADRFFCDATDVTVLLPRRADNMTWDGFERYLGKTDTSGKAVYYGPDEDFDLMMGGTSVTVVPRTAKAIADAIAWAPKFKSVFGLDTHISVTNAVEGSIGVSGSALESVTLETFSWVTFKVSNQTELDNTLAAVSTASPIVIDLTGLKRKESVVVPAGRRIAVLVPEGASCVKAEIGYRVIFR